MRVLMTADGVGGVFGFAVDLARELSARAVEVTLAVLGPALDADQRATLRAVRGLEVHERVGALEWMPEPWHEVDAATDWLRALAERSRADVVHLNGYACGAADYGVPKLVVAHSCVLGWWRAVRGEPPPEAFQEYARRVRAGLAGANLVVAPTQAMLDSLSVEYGYQGGRVISNGVDPLEFPRGKTTPCFVAAGRFWDRAKNIDLLLSAAPSLPWPLRLAGSGSQRPGLPAGVEALGVLSRSDLAGVLASSAVFIHPARYEPFGLAPLEAAHAGCALVLGDIPSLREVWGPAALYVPLDDPDALAAVANHLAHERSLRTLLAERARRRALDYTPFATATQYLAAYRELAGSAELGQAARERSSARDHRKEGSL